MKTKGSFFKLIIASIFLAAVPAIVSAQTTETRQICHLMSSLVNLSKGQAVSLNFTNVDRIPREVKLYILDANGDSLKSASWRVVPGQSVSLNFAFGELGRAPQRVGVRGVVMLSEPPQPDAYLPQPDLLLGNLEVYDIATGKMTFGLLLPAVRNINVLFPTDQ
jgi:hypothetical protein